MPLTPHWIRHYPRQHLRDDLIAGVLLTVLVIPQSLAYALLAGLPPQAGLYASILPAIAYAWFGSSMVQAVGPVAITAIMTASVLGPLAPVGSALYLQLAVWLSLGSGVLITLCGLARLGFLSQLLSKPVVSGFITGSALLIILSQLRFIGGIDARGNTSWQLLHSLWAWLPDIHVPTLLLGVGAVVALALARTGLKRWPMWQRLFPLLLILVCPWVVQGLALDPGQRIAVVGPVSLEWASLDFSMPHPSVFSALVGPTFLIAFIGMVQGITMAQALATQRRERIDANQELLGLGAANIAATFSGGMPVGGGLSRSAINVASGAQTPLAGIVSGISMLAVLLLGTDWLNHVPLAILAANIIIAAWGMIDLTALRQAWAYDRADAIAWLGTASGVLALGLETGIAVGIGLSLATLLWRTSSPHIAVIGRLPGTQSFRNVNRYATETLPRTLMLRIDESLFFGNLQAVEERLGLELARVPDTQDVVWVMTAVNRVDTSAMAALLNLNRDLKDRGIRMHFAEVKGPVQDRLVHTPLWTELSGEFFHSVPDAFAALQASRQEPHDAALSI